MKLATRAIRTGHQRTAEGEHCEPIFATSSFVFESAAEAAARFAGEQPGQYLLALHQSDRACLRAAAGRLGGRRACVATASGMAAILATCMGLLQAGDHIVSVAQPVRQHDHAVRQVPGPFRHRHRLCRLSDLTPGPRPFGPRRLLFARRRRIR
jgi:cystathionine beta-lyase/cystathionine gamma-synthase